MKAVFFDRDNTLIKDKNYMHKVSDLNFYEDSFSALKIIQNKGFSLFIVTNQSGIGRGFFSEEDMHSFHVEMLKQFSLNGIEFKGLAFCPHSPDDNCSCRKPSPTMIMDLAEAHKVDLTQSFMIGDKLIDAQCGINAGCTGFTINSKERSRFQDFKSLTQFAEYL